MFSQENQCLCPLSPDDRLKIRRKNECTPVKRSTKMKFKIGIKAMPFPPISKEPEFPNQWKRKRVTFTVPTIAEYEKKQST